MDDSKKPTAVTPTAAQPAPQARPGRHPYEAPRLEKQRSVSRATLFTGSGPDSGGLVG